jgi:hypothetical protein
MSDFADVFPYNCYANADVNHRYKTIDVGKLVA